MPDLRYDRLAVNTVVMNVNGTVRLCDIPYSEAIHQFNEDYLRLTRQVYDTNEDHLLGDEYMAVDTSTLVECEIDGVASVYSELFTNPFLAWGKYRRGFFKRHTTRIQTPSPDKIQVEYSLQTKIVK